MRLTILTQYYEPEIGAPQRRLSSLADHFVSVGHEVTVVTAMPNYPTGKIHPGYGGWLRRESFHAVKVIRTYIRPTQSARLIPRLLNYFSFVCSSAICGTWALKSSDYLLVESPPLFLGITAIWLSSIKSSKLIFNVSDLWPESAVHLGVIKKHSLSHLLGKRLEAWCYRKAWLVTGQSKSILADIQARFPSVRTLLLSNGADTAKFGPNSRTNEARSLLAPNGEFVVLYAGLLGLAQGLDQVLQAAQALQRERGLRFVFIGDGPKRQALLDQVQFKRIGNVVFLEPRTANEMPGLIASADLVVVPLKRNIPGAVPSKLYEAMASGRPVVLVAEGEAADIVRTNDCGLVVHSGDIAGLVSAIEEIRSDAVAANVMGRNGRNAAVEHFDRNGIARNFEAYLQADYGSPLGGENSRPDEDAKEAVPLSDLN